ncbi:thiopurine S-methyltransferase-like [Clavelina lepadiformis]|uniref:thiopurine S-methyltransferase-like n=1 Tax=Clavelina lepadiformis TaxID=159417 RepID=UPI0040422B8D
MASYNKGKVLSTYGAKENAVLVKEDWIKRWENHHIAFHMSQADPDLVKFKDILSNGGSNVFVPLCGKTLDLLYLAELGHEVIGCEICEMPILEFFEDHSVKYEKWQHPTAPFEIFKGIDKKITIYKGDFFELKSSIVGKFDGAWDRGAFGSVHPSLEFKYADVMNDLIKANGRYILSTFEYETSFPGPPFSVHAEDIAAALGRYFNISKLEYYETKDYNFLQRAACPVTGITISLLSPK